MNHEQAQVQIAGTAVAQALNSPLSGFYLEECSHVIKVAVNGNLAVCALCRKRFEEPTSAAIRLTTPKEGEGKVHPYPPLGPKAEVEVSY